jgi:glycosyltransferase involved in cell wall biosynthesis
MTEAPGSSSHSAPSHGATDWLVDGSRARVVMLHNQFRPAYTGAGIQAERLFRALVRRGVQLRVLCTLPRGEDAPLVEHCPGYTIYRFRIPRGDDEFRFTHGLRSAGWLLARSDWDLLHIHGFNYWSVLPTAVARLRRRPVLVKTTIIPGTPQRLFGIPQRIITAAFRRTSAVVALSDEIERIHGEDAAFRARVVRIPNGVDTDEFHPVGAEEKLAARSRFELPREALVIVSMGVLSERKNVVGLVEAAGRLRHRPVCVALAGPPSDLPQQRAAVKRAIDGLPEGVEARELGPVSGERLPQLLQAADVFALPSRSEGMPNSLLEGMASGLACVATDIPGSRDVLAHGGGRMIPLDDTDALARAFDELAANPEERFRLGEEAREVIERHYSIDQVAGRYCETYGELLAARRPPRGRQMD